MPVIFDGEVFETDLVKALVSAPDSVVLECIDAQSARQQQDDLDYPLHVALRRSRSEQVIRALVKTFPEAVQERGRDFMLPIHLACGLTEAAAAPCTAVDGEAPLRLEGLPTQWTEVIRLLLLAQAIGSRKHPWGASQTAGGGRLALHFAAARGAPPEAVQLLCDAFAAGAAHADAAGNTPLHALVPVTPAPDDTPAARAFNRRWLRDAPRVTAILLATAPHAARVRNGEGATPLELALRASLLPPAAVAALVAADMPLQPDGAAVATPVDTEAGRGGAACCASWPA